MSLVIPSQWAFVEGRKIIENVLLAHEVVNYYHRRNNSSRSAIKADLTEVLFKLLNQASTEAEISS